MGNKHCVLQNIFKVLLELPPSHFFTNLRLTFLIVCVLDAFLPGCVGSFPGALLNFQNFFQSQQIAEKALRK